MTENPQPPKRGGIAWQKARRLLRSALDDWPESFTPGELAVLQYPREGQDHEKRIALRNQRAMIDAIKASIEQGEVEAVTGTREVSIWETVLDSRASRGGRFASDTWLERDFAPRTVQVEKKETREFQTITRPIFAAWLRFSGFGDNEGQEKPSEHVRAWLGPEWKEGPGASAGAESSPVIERRKRAALIRELRVRWPSIECDLRHSGENGLNAAAKLPEHGDWNKTAALRWAEENGKLVDGTSKPQGFAPPRKVKLM